MSQEIRFTDMPLKASLKVGVKYAYCTCGHSEKFPHCDGSHREVGGEPIKFTVKANTDAWLCQCGRSGRKPYCDGSHQQ